MVGLLLLACPAIAVGGLPTWSTCRNWCWRHTPVTLQVNKVLAIVNGGITGLAIPLGGTLPGQQCSRHWRWRQSYLVNAANGIHGETDSLCRYFETRP